MKLSGTVSSLAKKAAQDYILGLHLPEGERLFHFCRQTKLVYKNGNDIADQPGREMCREMEATLPLWGERRRQRKLYLAPRSTFKTTILQAFAIYMVLRYPNIRILLIRATHADAIGVLRSIMQSLSTNTVVVNNWGDFSKTALIWTETAITVGARDNREMALKEPTIDTAGIGVSKTGYHPDYVMIDDPVNEVNYMSRKATDDGKLTIEALSPVLELHGSLIVTGTRWREGDLYGWLMEQDDMRVQEAARRGTDDPELARLWTRYIRSAYDLGNGEAGHDADGNPLELFFPSRLDWKELADQKSAVDIKLYTCWYENKATVEATRLFRPEQMQYYEATFYPYPTPTLEFDTGLIVPLRVCAQIDPVLTADADSDSLGLVVQGWDARDKHGAYRWWFLAAMEIRKVPSEATFDIVAVLKEFAPEILVIEAANADPEMVGRIALAIKDLGLPTHIKSYSALRDEKGERFEKRGRIGKGQRIEALEPIFRERRALLRRGRCALLVSQLLKYPHSDRDDVADAASMGRLVAGPCLESSILEVHDRLEQEEERLSYGPDGKPKRERPKAIRGADIGTWGPDWR